MGAIAFLFAGQGAQAPGMGRSLYETSPAARRLLDALEALRPGLLDLCFAGSGKDLLPTQNAQPALFGVDLAAAAAAREAGLHPACSAGFSLGEWAAVCDAGMLPFEHAFALVTLRAQWMQACADKHPGGMLAVLRLTAAQVEDLCAQHCNVWPVNYNAPGQTVVAGLQEALPAFAEAVATAGGRVLPLHVSGPFHSPAMEDAAQSLLAQLAQTPFAQPAIPVYGNLEAAPYTSQRAAQLLSSQAAHPVRWETTIRRLAQDGVTAFLELGPGTVLSGLVRKILPQATVAHVEDAASLQEAMALLGGAA